MIKIVTSMLLLSVSLLQAQDNSVNIHMPKVPEVPKVEAVVPKLTIINAPTSQTNAEIVANATKDKTVVFSNRVAPFMLHKDENINKDANKTIEVGDINNGKVTAYLHAPLMSTQEVQKVLESAGFNILTTYKVDKKGLVTSLVFTNEAIQKAAAKTNRGFASTLRVTVDTKDRLISISNPIYLMKAFMQEEYDAQLAEKTLRTLRESFTTLENSTELVKFRILKHFKFMEGMPTYNDMIHIKKASNETLLQRAKKSKKLLYSQTLANGSIVVGVKLSKRTTKFIKKTGYQNAGLLPYPVLIENGEVKILDPKYYIAVMYPTLKMSQFMKIATVPGAITKDIDKIFR